MVIYSPFCFFSHSTWILYETNRREIEKKSESKKIGKKKESNISESVSHVGIIHSQNVRICRRRERMNTPIKKKGKFFFRIGSFDPRSEIEPTHR